jgi:hypothetical protein
MSSTGGNMSRGSNSYYVCLFNNRLRDKIEDLRADGKITREMEGILSSIISVVHSTLDYKYPDRIISIEEARANWTKEIDNILNDTPFDLKEFMKELNSFIGKLLLKIEDKRIAVNKIKSDGKLIGRTLLRTSIYLNECSAALLVTNDFLNDIINCEDESELEFLLMSSSDKE